MKIEELVILLPCHSLEDFPVHARGAEAEGLLAAWTALWHPALLAAAGDLPVWYRADGPPENLSGRLIVIPTASETLLWEDWPSRAEMEGALLVRDVDRRPQLLAECLKQLDEMPDVDAELTADFLALGLGYLLVELLTRQMRYMSNVDEARLRTETLAAAAAAVAGQTSEARERLKNCFEVLVEARERFYPVECYLIDLTLTAPRQPSEPLVDELRDLLPRNLLIEARTTFDGAAPAAIASALADRRLSIVGGESQESLLPLMDPESCLAQLRPREYEAQWGARPIVYGRRRCGLTPLLPQMLSQLGYVGALHFTLDDGVFPVSPQAKFRWQGLDSSAIDAIGRIPLDANAPETFLTFPTRMGESMDLDHVATVLFAHWPGHVSEFYGDLRRVSRYAPVLGRFVTLEDYFRNTESPGELTRFRADQYRTAYLRQAADEARPNAISSLAEATRRGVRLDDQFARTWLSALGAEGATIGVEPREATRTDRGVSGAHDRQAHDARSSRIGELAPYLMGKAGDCRGIFVVNAHSFARKAAIDVSSLAELPAIEGPVLAAQESGGRKLAVIDLPAAGFAWIEPAAAPPRLDKKAKPPVPIASELTLSNEFMRVAIHAETGGIRSVHDSVQRKNRLSQQIAYRLPAATPRPGDAWGHLDDEPVYSAMQAERIEITANGTAVGEITSHGRLTAADGSTLCRFTQRTRLARGARTVAIDIELAGLTMPDDADPWSNYVACRFAWAPEFIDMYRSVAMTVQPTSLARIEAPHFVKVRHDRRRIAFLTCGLPFHRLVDDHQLDTLLVVARDEARAFRLGIGIDADHPLHEAIALADPLAPIDALGPHGKGSRSSWLFHVDAPNVVVTSWDALHGDERRRGIRARLLESEGRAGRVALTAFRRFSAARQVDFLGQTLVELPVDGERILLDIAAYEWVQVEAEFA